MLTQLIDNLHRNDADLAVHLALLHFSNRWYLCF